MRRRRACGAAGASSTVAAGAGVAVRRRRARGAGCSLLGSRLKRRNRRSAAQRPVATPKLLRLSHRTYGHQQVLVGKHVRYVQIGRRQDLHPLQVAGARDDVPVSILSDEEGRALQPQIPQQRHHILCPRLLKAQHAYHLERAVGGLGGEDRADGQTAHPLGEMLTEAAGLRAKGDTTVTDSRRAEAAQPGTS